MLYPNDYQKNGFVSATLADETASEAETTAFVPSPLNAKYGTFREVKQLQKGLHERHMRMIGIAGSIGTGLFLNIGGAISAGGPLGALLGYAVIGMAVCSVVLCVGEMGALVPLSGALVRYIEYFVDPALSFSIGWNLVYACLISGPAELTAAAIMVQFWVTVNNAIWVTVFGALTLFTILLFVRVYGEVEYVSSLLKLVLIIGINLMALFVATTGTSIEEPTGFKFWQDPGPFVQFLDVPGPAGRFLGVWACARTAFYAYSGLEGIAVTAAETRNPRKAIPMAARGIFFRIITFYIITLLMMGLVIPSDDPALLRMDGTVSQSPFVIAARRAGFKAVPSIVNSVALITAYSAANNSTLRGSRYLYGLATMGHAPAIFTSVSRFGVPYIAVGLHGLIMCMAYLTMYSSVSIIFGWLQSLIAIAALINWLTVCVTYLRFYYGCKKQGIDRKTELPWAAPFQPYSTWFSLVLLVVVLIGGNPSVLVASQFNPRDFVSAYFNIISVSVLYFGYKFYHKTRIVPLAELPIRQFIDIANSDTSYQPGNGNE